MQQKKDLIRQLDAQFDKLMSLNPDRDDLDPGTFVKLGKALKATAFEHFSERVEELAEAYVHSPAKMSEKCIVTKYLNGLDASARRLAEQGAIRMPEHESVRGSGSTSSVALVPRKLYSSTDWIKILQSADLPHRLVRAVDAAAERNRLVHTVLPVAFRTLHEIDNRAAFEWELTRLDEREGILDSDLVRDLIRTWQQLNEIDDRALRWVMHWSVDENLERQWPGVVSASDRLLRRRALQKWFADNEPRSSGLRHLLRIMKSPAHGEQALWQWLNAAVADVGRELKLCVGLRRSLTTTATDEEKRPLQASIVRRLAGLERQFVPVLLLADLLIRKPDGVYWLALATLGISHADLSRWRKKLQEQAYDIVQKVFLANLRQRVSPQETIRKLCFGDKILAQTLINRLDLLTREFESIEDKDAVAEELAVNYASYREGDLLRKSLSGRYRQVMALLHEDTLKQILPDMLNSTQGVQMPGLRDIYSLIGDARRYLNRRFSPHLSAEEIIGSELDFARRIRQQRFRLINVLLCGRTESPF